MLKKLIYTIYYSLFRVNESKAGQLFLFIGFFYAIALFVDFLIIMKSFNMPYGRLYNGVLYVAISVIMLPILYFLIFKKPNKVVEWKAKYNDNWKAYKHYLFVFGFAFISIGTTALIKIIVDMLN